MSAHPTTPEPGALEAPARLVDWVRAMDPVVRRMVGIGILTAVAVLGSDPVLGVALLSAALLFGRWARPDAVARHRELVAVADALEDLERRLIAGELDTESFERRRAWLRETART